MMNGYTNPETFHFVLNVDNDETLLAIAREAVKYARANGAETTEGIGEIVGQRVHDHLLETEDSVPASHSMLHDVGSFWRVDEREIGTHYADMFPPEDAIEKLWSRRCSLATLLGDAPAPWATQ